MSSQLSPNTPAWSGARTATPLKTRAPANSATLAWGARWGDTRGGSSLQPARMGGCRGLHRVTGVFYARPEVPTGRASREVGSASPGECIRAPRHRHGVARAGAHRALPRGKCKGFAGISGPGEAVGAVAKPAVNEKLAVAPRISASIPVPLHLPPCAEPPCLIRERVSAGRGVAELERAGRS